MQISAVVKHSPSGHDVVVRSGANPQVLSIAPKANGKGSAVNGGEFLMLALATCYCNDVYREAERLGIEVDAIEVEASAEFAGIGLAATDIRYRARVSSRATPDQIAELLRQTDAVAEVHNTIRAGMPVELVSSSCDGLMPS